jgi:hypothetical protein
MSDFGELCPLFNTGVFGEVTFPIMTLSAKDVTADLLAGSTDQARPGYFTFGRTVIVTEAFLKRELINTTETTLWLRHKLSGTQGIIGTVFGSITIPLSMSAHQHGFWKKFVPFVGRTFTSDEVLALGVASDLTVSSGKVALMVRYKEK